LLLLCLSNGIISFAGLLLDQDDPTGTHRSCRLDS
jgi:hypothetical protein